MRALVAAGLGLALACQASLAHADDVTGLGLALDAQDASMRIESDTNLRTPRVHTERGTVRLWFAGLAQTRFLDQPGDGQVVRRASVRPGEADTALVVLRLGDRRKLSARDVRVTVEGHTATLRIARALLPQGVPAAAPAAPGPAAVAPATATPAATAPAAAASTAAVPAVSAPVVAASAPAVAASAPAAGAAPAGPAAAASAAPAAAVAAAPSAATPAPAAGAAASTPRLTTSAPTEAPLPPGAGAFAGTIPDAKGAGLRTIGLIVALLGGLALFGRWLRQRRASQPEAAIRVLASHRLGSKHQLIVVRAFDQEILLSVNGNETRRIASRRAGEPTELAPMGDGETPVEHRGAAVGRLLAMVPAAAPSFDRPAPTAEPAKAAGSLPFSDELARMVRAMAPGATQSRPAVSDSVSGLVRLRESKVAR